MSIAMPKIMYMYSTLQHCCYLPVDTLAGFGVRSIDNLRESLRGVASCAPDGVSTEDYILAELL